MIRLLGSRGASAAMGFFMLALGAGEAAAATASATAAPSIATPIPVVAVASDTIKLPAPAPLSALTIANAVPTPLTRGAAAIAAPQSITATLSPIAAIPALFRQTLPQDHSLAALVDTYSAGAALDEQANCLATAVYFESMGEPLEGQLAVARVVLNRAASGRYPATWCGVVKQKAQFSFVRAGRFPRIDAGCQAWRKAQAIARIAMANAAASLPTDVLWYHADYVAPSWGRRLTKVEKIGAHIFYRA